MVTTSAGCTELAGWAMNGEVVNIGPVIITVLVVPNCTKRVG